MPAKQGPLDLSCRCKECRLEFFIININSQVSGSDGFSVSHLSCPNCKASDIEVNITIHKQEVTDEFGPLKKQFDEAFRTFQASDDPLAKHRLTISILNLMSDLNHALSKSLKD